MRYAITFLWTAFLLFGTLTKGFAETLTVEQLEGEINRLRKEFARLEEKQSFASNLKTALNPQISLDALFTVGGATVGDEQIAAFQGGTHDPNRQGITVQNIEMSMSAAVDPYLDGQANIIYQINSAGESILEVEEVFFSTRALPFGLQVKGGQFFTEFGRLNNTHPHAWSFVDQPVVNTRMFGGDGLRNPGMRISWLAPLSWYSEFYFAFQQANGETAQSFLGAPGEDFGGRQLLEHPVAKLKDLLYSARWINSFDLSSTGTLNLGLSALTGPNATGFDKRTEIYGADMYFKWQPLSTQQGWPFVAWQTEGMARHYEAGAFDDGTTVLNEEPLKDWGLYSQILWGLTPRWVVGTRFDVANGNSGKNDPLRDFRRRGAGNITWYPSEFSKFRLQYNYGQAEYTSNPVHAIWLQFEFMIGAHAAHIF